MDLFIQSMAHRLREAADPTDMVARIDDADFVILFRRSLTPEAEKKYADKLVKEAGRAFAAGIDSMNASIFYGTSHYPSDSRHGGELIAIAEERMSKAAAELQALQRMTRTQSRSRAKRSSRARAKMRSSLFSSAR